MPTAKPVHAGHRLCYINVPNMLNYVKNLLLYQHNTKSYDYIAKEISVVSNNGSARDLLQKPELLSVFNN
jgi:hypothetical protein